MHETVLRVWNFSLFLSDATIKSERSIYMDIKEFIELYINSSEEIQKNVERILEEVQQQIEFQE